MNGLIRAFKIRGSIPVDSSSLSDNFFYVSAAFRLSSRYQDISTLCNIGRTCLRYKQQVPRLEFHHFSIHNRRFCATRRGILKQSSTTPPFLFTTRFDRHLTNIYKRLLDQGHFSSLSLRFRRKLSFFSRSLSSILSPIFPFQPIRIQSEVARVFWPRLFSKVPKGFEKFCPDEDNNNKKSLHDEKHPENSREPHDQDKRGWGDNKNNGDANKPPPPQPSSIHYPLIAFLSFFVLLNYFLEYHFNRGWSYNHITTQYFLTNLLAKGYVDRVDIINKEFVRVVLRTDCPKDVLPSKGYYVFRIASAESFESKLEGFQFALGIHPVDFVSVQHLQEVDFISEVLGRLPIILVGLGLLFFFRQLVYLSSANDANRFLRVGRANPVSGKDVKVKIKFSDVAGMTEAKHEIMEFIDFLKDPKKYQQLGAHIPKGALLVGPPGTGKTLLAKAVAGEANVPFFSMSGSDFIEVFVGVGPSRVRDLFQIARKNSPSIIFIDEIDAVGRKRSRGGFAGGANDERENTLNQMLVEMDGFTTSTGVVVLAGTNRADVLDPALTRPGRFDRTVNIEKPDLAERTDIFRLHMKPLKLDPLLNRTETYRRLAALTPGFVGADISNVCNEAAIYAARRNGSGVSIADFENACERILGGMKKSSGFINQDLRRVIAFHEAGHAVAGWFLKYGDPVLKVSIVPRTSGALGFAQNLPDEVQLLPRQQILDKIAVLLGGRVSEELNIGRISTGASDDLDKVTKLAYAFVSVWGFSPKVGLMSFQQREEARYYKPYSEQLAQVIDSEVREMIDYQYNRVKTLLIERGDLLKQLTEKLLMEETITFHDMREILGERPYPLRSEYAEYVEAAPHKKELENVEEKDESKHDPPKSDPFDSSNKLDVNSGTTVNQCERTETLVLDEHSGTEKQKKSSKESDKFDSSKNLQCIVSGILNPPLIA